jgi:hypothetical protein
VSINKILLITNDTTQKQSKLVIRINKILLITNDMTQKQSKLVTRINKLFLNTNDMSQEHPKLVTSLNKILLIANDSGFINNYPKSSHNNCRMRKSSRLWLTTILTYLNIIEI